MSIRRALVMSSSKGMNVASADHAAAASAGAGRRARALWPGSTTAALLIVGIALAVGTFAVVLAMPPLPWHTARDLELEATYQTYRETGVLLVKHTGEGSWYTQIGVPGGLAPAAWDDDPGAYMAASLMSHVTGAPSAQPGLRDVMAFLIAAPLVILPLGVARLFLRARAGYALLLLPAVLWLTNHGTVLAGTEYGLADKTSPLRVYALYGIAASLLFLTLTLLLVLSTFRLRPAALVAATIGIGVLGGLGNLCRSMSGIGAALAVGVLWLVHQHGRARWWRALAASVVGVGIAAALPMGVMHVVDGQRAQAIGMSTADLPTAHAVWHSVYLGLSYPEPITGQPSPFGIVWSDQYGWDQARAVDPSVVIASSQYDTIMRHLYADQVRTHPETAVRTYIGKAVYTVEHFGGMLVVIAAGVGLALARAGRHRRSVGAAVGMVLPAAALGMVPVVLVMPLLYYFSELSAVLGLLVALAVGAIAWALSTVPSYIRARERRRTLERLADTWPAQPTAGISVVVPTRNGATTVARTLERLVATLAPEDEILVVENGSTDNTTEVLTTELAGWSHSCQLRVLHSEPGLGNALRTGVLASHGGWLLLTADDLPFGTGDLEQFRLLPDTTLVAIGSKAHPDSRALRTRARRAQSIVFRGLRSLLLHSWVGDSQGTIWVAGRWARIFAMFSQETGLMWTTELVLAAEQQGIPVTEVAVSLEETHEAHASRFSPLDAARSLRGVLRLALRKDDFTLEDWRRPVPAGSNLPLEPAYL